MEKTSKSKSSSWLGNLVLIVVLIIAFPFWLKMDKEKIYDKDGIRIYASSKIKSEDAVVVAEKALAILQKKGIELQNSTSIVFYDSRDEFKWRNLFISRGALAMNWWPFPYITFAPVDMANDKQQARKEILNERPVSSVIAHELTHTYQAEQLNLFVYKYNTFCHKWKVEGMAETYSESSSLPLDKGLELFLKDATSEELDALEVNGEYFYFKSHLKADYLLNYKETSEKDFWNNDYDESQLELEIRNAIRNGAYTPNWDSHPRDITLSHGWL